MSKRNIIACIGLCILAGFAAWAVHAFQWAEDESDGMDATRALLLFGLLHLAGFVWLVTCSPWGPLGRTRAVIVFMLCCVVFACCVRVDGFMGDRWPVWTWRFSHHSAPDFFQQSVTEESEISGQLIDALLEPGEDDWPAFRGAHGAGVLTHRVIDGDWNAGQPELLWRRAIGRGWSSFAVQGVCGFTQEQRAAFEAVVCYRIDTGQEIWSHTNEVRFNDVMSGDGPRCTPSVSAGKVYSLGATGILNCLNARDGNNVWSVNILDDFKQPNAPFGMCGSPLVVDDLVIVNPGGDKTSLAAFHKETGALIWAGGRGDAAYSSPMVGTIAGRRQVVNFHGEGISGYSLETGEELWHHRWITNPPEKNNVCQPIVFPNAAEDSSDFVFISSGYGEGCTLLSVSCDQEKWQVRERWWNLNLKSKFSSAVALGDYLFGLDNRSLVCLRWRDGKRMWKAGHYGYGQLIRVADKIVVQAESGNVALVAADASGHRELGNIDALAARTWNHPVFVGDKLIVRNDREVACYRIPSHRRGGSQNAKSSVPRDIQ